MGRQVAIYKQQELPVLQPEPAPRPIDLMRRRRRRPSLFWIQAVCRILAAAVVVVIAAGAALVSLVLLVAAVWLMVEQNNYMASFVLVACLVTSLMTTCLAFGAKAIALEGW